MVKITKIEIITEEQFQPLRVTLDMVEEDQLRTTQLQSIIPTNHLLSVKD